MTERKTVEDWAIIIFEDDYWNIHKLTLPSSAQTDTVSYSEFISLIKDQVIDTPLEHYLHSYVRKISEIKKLDKQLNFPSKEVSNELQNRILELKKGAKPNPNAKGFGDFDLSDIPKKDTFKVERERFINNEAYQRLESDIDRVYWIFDQLERDRSLEYAMEHLQDVVPSELEEIAEGIYFKMKYKALDMKLKQVYRSEAEDLRKLQQDLIGQRDKLNDEIDEIAHEISRLQSLYIPDAWKLPSESGTPNDLRKIHQISRRNALDLKK